VTDGAPLLDEATAAFLETGVSILAACPDENDLPRIVRAMGCRVSSTRRQRLVLLERRLTERNAPLRIEKVARGRFRLRVERPLTLTEMGGG
jgi:hypothetical protein